MAGSGTNLSIETSWSSSSQDSDSLEYCRNPSYASSSTSFISTSASSHTTLPSSDGFSTYASAAPSLLPCPPRVLPTRPTSTQSAPASPAYRPLPKPPRAVSEHIVQSAAPCIPERRAPSPSPSTSSSIHRRLRPLPVRPGPPRVEEIFAPVAKSSLPQTPARVPSPPRPRLAVTIPPSLEHSRRMSAESERPQEEISPIVFVKSSSNTPSSPVFTDHLPLAPQDWDCVPLASAVGFAMEVDADTQLESKSRKIQVEKKGKRFTQQSRDHAAILQRLRMLK